MKLKLDENLGRSSEAAFSGAGHEVETVAGERLSGAPDRTVYGRCIEEQRALVTLDMDFANVLAFPPDVTAGLIVLRVGGRITPDSIEELVDEAAQLLAAEPVTGRLWIVEPGRVRVHVPREP
jgi:predicted nuclease of predicted toxin-antitoxin system